MGILSLLFKKDYKDITTEELKIMMKESLLIMLNRNLILILITPGLQVNY